MSDKQWNAEKYARHAGFVSGMALPVVALLNPRGGERILDVGCGDGTLAVVIEQAGAKVVGIDSSVEMVEKARAKGIESYVMSATELAFENEFDAVFSNAALHWIKDARAALDGICRALKPGGRLVAELGGAGNIRHLTDAMQAVFDRHREYGRFDNPWYFPGEAEYGKALSDSGFRVDSSELIPRPTPVDDIDNWLEVFANGIISRLTPPQRAVFNREVRSLLEPQIYSDADGWVADYVRLRVSATKVA